MTKIKLVFISLLLLNTNFNIAQEASSSNKVTAKLIGQEDKMLHMSANLVVTTAEELLEYVDRAQASGANAVLFSDAKLNTYGLNGTFSDTWDSRMNQLVDGVKSRGMKFNVITITMGFAGTLIASDPNLTTGYPIENQELEATNGVLVPVSSANIANGGFENFSDNTPTAWGFQDAIGERTFIDTDIKRSGNASFRAEAMNGESSRIFTVFDVKPFHQYTLQFWIRTENLTARNLAALIRDDNNKERTLTNLHISLPKDNGGQQYYERPNQLTTVGWEEVRIAFNSLNATRVNLALAVFGGEEGTIWWDDVQVFDTPALNWINRNDLPRSVKHSNGQNLSFGADVELPVDTQLGISGFQGAFDTQHLAPEILIINTTNINEGDVIEINGYHALPTASGQISASWNNPEIYNRMRTIHQTLQNDFQPDGFLINYSEIRTGGWEPSDINIGTSGIALATSIERAFEDLFEVAPDANYYFWNDMVDPNHNAIEDYYQVNNTLDQSWLTLNPNKVTIATWWEGQKITDFGPSSLSFFADKGFKQILGAFYDEDVTDNYNRWVSAAEGVDQVSGSIYATWTSPKNFTKIEEFGELWWSVNQLNDEIISVDGPNTVSPAAIVNIDLEYSAPLPRDIIVILQLNRAPWTNYGSARVTVPAGMDNIEIQFSVNENIPLANNDYKWQSLITPENGDWNDRLDDLQEINISAQMETDLCPPDWLITSDTPFQAVYQTGGTIETSGSLIIRDNENVEYQANRIRLNEGFQVNSNANFGVVIGDCE